MNSHGLPLGYPNYHDQSNSINLSIILPMNKYSVLIVFLWFFSGRNVQAQAIRDKEDAKEAKQETVDESVATEDKPAPVVKVVPSVRTKKAKPEKVTSAKPRTAKPGGNRSARSPRPSARPARPGNGRN